MAKKKPGGRIEIVLENLELIDFCNDEIVALANKMSKFKPSTKTTP